VLAGCAAPLPAGGLAIGLLGDTPYSAAEVRRLDLLIDDLNAAPLAFVVHVGDIGTSKLACDNDWLSKRKIQFERIRHPFVLLPGDNEWSECRDPVERLRVWRRLFCFTSLRVDVQKTEFCEHVRWEAGGLVFVALNVPGNSNNIAHPEHGPRMAAAYAWLEEAAQLAQSRDGLVVLMQANPFVVFPRDGYADLRKKLTTLGQTMPGKVILVHGDTHLWQDDEPLPGVRRIEVWGSPFVGWLDVAIAGGRLGASAPHHR